GRPPGARACSTRQPGPIGEARARSPNVAIQAVAAKRNRRAADSGRNAHPPLPDVQPEAWRELDRATEPECHGASLERPGARVRCASPGILRAGPPPHDPCDPLVYRNG